MADNRMNGSGKNNKSARILLYTGKGGVGKTTMAAATGVQAAQMGYRTVVMSTDAAHSLADSFDTKLGPVPEQVAPNLWGQEIDIFHELRHHWGTIQNYMAAVMAWRGLDDIVAEEMTVLPGMEELASLLQIIRYYDDSEFDLVVVDCAPTGETLRLLSFPEVARWWMEKMFPIERKAATVLRPIMRPLLDVPLPGDEVFESIQNLFMQLDRMHKVLADPDVSSVRLVLNPEKMVIKEAQRTYTYLNLFDYPTDLVICNRIIPAGVQDQFFAGWKESQDKYYHSVEDAFTPLPILRVPLLDREVVGMEMLKRLAESLFDGRDPTDIFFKGRTQSIEKCHGDYVLTLPLPLVSKQDIVLSRSGDELLVHVGNFKRNVILPKALVGLDTKQAKLEEGVLRIWFNGATSGATDSKRK